MLSDSDRLTALLMAEAGQFMKNGRLNCTKLAENLIANGVIVLPCKVGDKVYLPCLNDWGDIENYTITEFVLDNDGLLFVVDDEDRETHPIEEIGTDVFLTKEEAEKALERSKG